MAKQKNVSYECPYCGYTSTKWLGFCPQCRQGALEEVKTSSTVAVSANLSDKILNIREINSDEQEVRYKTGLSELDRVLGGGLVKGSVVLIGGAPGIGKSTLLLQICQHLGKSSDILYISGEESVSQIKLRADRLGVDSENLFLLSSSDAQEIANTISKETPDIAIIDSIQTMVCDSSSSSAGSIVQVRECTNLFMKVAKTQDIPIFIVGHVNKDGAIAGPKVMEHMVDTVLYFEGDRNLPYRILRGIKNRFGSTNEIGIFDMADRGLRQVENPSMMFLEGRPTQASGCAVSCVIEGTRPIMVEIQALVAKSAFAVPRRLATGIDFGRMAILVAVLEKRLGFFFGQLDVYLNVVGGLRIDEPAVDLAIAIALYSGLTDKVVSPHIIAVGEVGLGGEIRSVSRVEQRIMESARMGFEKILIPRSCMAQLDKDIINQKDIEIVPVSDLKQALGIVFGKKDKNNAEI